MKHFAGDVVYFAGEFLDKNNDSLDGDVEQAILNSSLSLIATVCTPQAADEPTGGKRKAKSSFASVGDKFVKSLKSLMGEPAPPLRTMGPHPQPWDPTLSHGAPAAPQLSRTDVVPRGR